MIGIVRITKRVKSGYKHLGALRDGMIDLTTIYLPEPNLQARHTQLALCFKEIKWHGENINV